MASASSYDLGRRLHDLLLKKESATAALQDLCTQPVRAVLIAGTSLPDQTLINLLNLPTISHTAVSVRHVYLMCGTKRLSEAWNVYVPSRLTEAARHALADQHTPFGHAVGSDFFWRERLNSRLTDLPTGIILENRALLRRKTDHLPIAAVIERYTPEVLQR